MTIAAFLPFPERADSALCSVAFIVTVRQQAPQGLSCTSINRVVSVLLRTFGIEGGDENIGVARRLVFNACHASRCDGFSRMCEGVDGFELAHGDLCVDLGGGEFGMAEHGLDKADVGPVFEHQRCHGVPEQVA